MKKVRLLLIGALILGASLLNTGCLSMAVNAAISGSAKSQFRKEIAKETPELNKDNSVIIFGTAGSYAEFIQQNPKLGKKAIKSYGGSTSAGLFTQYNYFVLKPVPLNSEMKLTYYTFTAGKTTYNYYEGIAGVDFVCSKPGVFYFGSGDADAQKAVLEEVLDFYKGTEWAPLIEARITELKGAKK